MTGCMSNKTFSCNRILHFKELLDSQSNTEILPHIFLELHVIIGQESVEDRNRDLVRV